MPKLRTHESETVELKEKWNDSALEALAAFANHEGGTVYVGVRDDGDVVECDVSDAEQQRIANQIVQVLGLRPSITVQKQGKSAFLAVTVQPSNIPTPCRGRYLTRVGTTNRDMTPDDIGRRTMEQLGETWDALPSKLTLKDIDKRAFRQFVRRAQTRLPRITEKDSPAQVLGNIELIKKDVLTKGAVLLFGRNPLQVCSTAQVHLGRFKGDLILDNRFIKGNLWEQLDATMDAIRGYLQVRQEVRSTAPTLEGLQRHDIWEYPLDALREALINALIHRDYTALGNIQIRVTDDSIRILSPGGLPHGMTLKKLLQEPHGSFPRNPFLAETFFLAGLIESWGTGILRMRNLCLQQKLSEPQFQVESDSFLVIFSKDPFHEDRLMTLGLGEAQRRLVIFTKENRTITNRQVQELIGVSKATAARTLDELVERGILLRRGKTGRGSHYVLNVSTTSQTSQKRLKNEPNGS